MMTTYLLAFEPRIAVAVPACNPCTWSHRVHANLSTDHEQVFFGAFAAGIDPRGDPLFCQAPKPLLIDATSEDNLNPPSGVWELSTWLYKAYSAHGAPHKFQTSMVEAPHGYNREQREVAYAWMLQWTGGDASDFQEEDFPVEKEADTWCTSDGNVYREPRSRSPHDLVIEYFQNHRLRYAKEKENLQDFIRKTLCLKESVPAPKVEIGTARSAAGLRLTPVTIEPEDGILLPCIWIESSQRRSDGPVIVYLDDKGKTLLAGEKIVLPALLEKGCRVFAADLRGTGETAPGMEGKFWDFLAGRSVFGQRVADVCAVVQYVSQSDVEGKRIYVWARGVSAIYAALAATLEESVTGLVLEEPLLTFEQVVTTKVPAYRHEIILPGVLEQFDLPQVYQALYPRKVALINPLMGDKSRASGERAAEAYRQVVRRYTLSGTSDNWSVQTNLEGEPRSKAVLSAFQ